jgi:hypothetical protein
MTDELTGIERAVMVAGTQKNLTILMAAVPPGSVPVVQSSVSKWLFNGYVSNAYAGLVAKATGIPIEDLIRKTPRRRRSRSKRAAAQTAQEPI